MVGILGPYGIHLDPLKLSPRVLALLCASLGAAFLLRELFPKRELVASPPRIVTVYDTITKTRWRFDSAALQRAIGDLKPEIKYIERITASLPETVYRVPPLIGLTALVVAPHVGDSTLAQGFELTPQDSGYALRQWQTQTWTAGSLRAFAFVDGKPVIGWNPPPPKSCQFGCRAKFFLWGAALGMAGWELAR